MREKIEKRCKGISKPVVKNSITFEDYKSCLFSKETRMREMNVPRNHGHDMYTDNLNKVALSANDDKRIIREDSIHTYAYGHYAAPSSEKAKLSRDDCELDSLER